MTDRETRKDDGISSSGERKRIAEMHPNPHSEQEIAEMRIETDHSAVTLENLAQNPNTVENRMDRSVVVQDASTDSMFNVADPQTEELLNPETGKKRESNRGWRTRPRKAA